MNISTLDPRRDLTGKVLPRRVPANDKDRLILTYRKSEAEELRRLAESITLKGKRATLSTLVRRALALYRIIYRHDPQGEQQALEALVTEVPQKATVSKKKKAP